LDRLEASHTKKSIFEDIKTEPINFPIVHPLDVIRDSIADNSTEKNMFSGQSFIKKD